MKLRSKLSLSDCKARLGSATDLTGHALSWDAAGMPGMMGEFRGSAFRLHTSKYYRNSFVPFFYGKLTETDRNAVVEGGFRMNPFIRLAMAFWLVFLGFFALAIVIVPTSAQRLGGVGRGTLFAGLIVLALLGAALVQIGKWHGRGEKEVIHSFLKKTLEASDDQ